MTDGSLIAEVGCPECRRLVARIVKEGPDISVHHRLPMGIVDRPDHERGVVEVRPWTFSIAEPPTPGRYAVWESTCREVKCPGVFALDTRRIAQLVRRYQAAGKAIRWQPGPADVERSEVLRSIGHGFGWQTPETAQERLRVVLSEPPDLVDIKALGIRAHAPNSDVPIAEVMGAIQTARPDRMEPNERLLVPFAAPLHGIGTMVYGRHTVSVSVDNGAAEREIAFWVLSPDELVIPPI